MQKSKTAFINAAEAYGAAEAEWRASGWPAQKFGGVTKALNAVKRSLPGAKAVLKVLGLIMLPGPDMTIIDTSGAEEGGLLKESYPMDGFSELSPQKASPSHHGDDKEVAHPVSTTGEFAGPPPVATASANFAAAEGATGSSQPTDVYGAETADGLAAND